MTTAMNEYAIPLLYTGYGFPTIQFLNDCPEYRGLFKKLKIPDLMDQSVCTERAKETVVQSFDAQFSVHLPGRISDDLREAGHQHYPPDSNFLGYMARTGENLNEFYVALTCNASGPPYATINIGALLHEYGHYVEERHCVHLLENGDDSRGTSYFDALLWCMEQKGDVLTYDDESSNLAFEIAAWLNSIWLCWLFSVDPKQALVGMVVNLQSKGRLGQIFIENEIPKILKIATNRTAAERFFREGDYERGFDNFFQERDVLQRCLQIDDATSRLLIDISIHED
jgi:hypothetical protein